MEEKYGAIANCNGYANEVKKDGRSRFGRGPRLSRFTMLDLYHLLDEIIVIPSGDMGMTCGGIVATIFVSSIWLVVTIDG